MVVKMWFIYLLSCTIAVTAAPVSDAFPIVDLGYARHAPTKINYTTARNMSYATYANIRFAQPPVGDLRFRAPQTPPPVANGVQDGVVLFNSTNCLQAIPYWFPLAGLNGSSWGSEDCLFLDVIVPDGVKQGSNVPVLHWVYGGGYFYGAKDNGGNPAALLNDIAESEKFIVVASNYRLGALGYMSSDTEPTMVRNAGIYDTLAASEWIKDNIHRFGGDGMKVTIMGQSAGAGNIEHLLAASLQGTTMPFSQAVLSSPGNRPHVNRSIEMTSIYRQFLNATNCTDVSCLRKLPSSAMAAANRYMLLDLPPSGGFPGPSISFVPILDDNRVKRPALQVLAGNTTATNPAYIKRVITGNLIHEGAASSVGDYKSWQQQLSIFARTPTNATTNTVQSLYGAFNGSTTSFSADGNVTQETPFDHFSGDIIYRCAGQLSARAFSTSSPQSKYWQGHGMSTASFRYVMSIPPALHGQDLSYYFYDKVVAAVDPTVNTMIARQFQRYLRGFILGLDMEDWPEYSSSGLENPSWMNITSAGFQKSTGQYETNLTTRCRTIVGLLSNTADGW